MEHFGQYTPARHIDFQIQKWENGIVMSYFIIIRGPMGSGKTTIAKVLSDRLNAHYISVDDVIDQNELQHDREDGYISQKSFLRANEIVIPEARQSLEGGIPVVFDGNFYWKSQIDDLIVHLNSAHAVFTLKIPFDLCVERDHLRKLSYGSDAVEVVYNKVSVFDYGENIDATQTLELCVDDILSKLPSLD